LSRYDGGLQTFYPLNAAQQALHEKMQQQGLDALLLEYGGADTAADAAMPLENAHEDAPRG